MRSPREKFLARGAVGWPAAVRLQPRVVATAGLVGPAMALEAVREAGTGGYRPGGIVMRDAGGYGMGWCKSRRVVDDGTRTG